MHPTVSFYNHEQSKTVRDFDLLTGLLAYQLRLASAGTLAWYAQSLETSPDTALVDFLLEKRAIHAEDAKLLGELAGHVVQAHGGNAGAALQAFGGPEAAEEAFARAVLPTEQGWVSPDAETGDDRTIVAEQLPHGLPRQITPETAGRYTGGSEYARGGIGRILLVHDEQIGRSVILKELLPHRATSPSDTTLSRVPPADSPGTPMRQSAAMIARFLQEAKITGQLEHPSIVPVYELGLRADGQLYYTMKLVRGNTLTESIAGCKTLDDRLALIRPFLDVCQAMAYAHAKGVIHRDLKPSNIMVGEFGECVVLDWGLAKMREGKDAHAEDMEKTMSRLRISHGEMNAARTGSNDILGTPLYMAPEQARGEVDTVTYHSDVYSLGVILYEMLTGFTPHRWTNTYDTVRRVAALPVPPVCKHAPKTPPELAAICDKALQFDELDRYPSAKELAADVQRFLEGALVDAYAYSVRDQLGRLYRQHKPAVLSTAGAAALVLIIGVIAYAIVLHAWDNEREQRLLADDAKERAVASRDEAEEARGEAEEALQLAQRQQYLAQIRLAQSHIEDQQMRLANEALEAAPTVERNWVWNYLYDEANADIFTVRSETSTIYQAVYNRTGDLIVAIRSDEPPGLWSASDGSLIRDFEGDAQTYYSSSFSEDGTRFAAIGENGILDVWDIATGQRALHSSYESGGLSVAFAGKSTHVWGGYDDGTLLEWDIESGSLHRTIATGENTVSILHESGSAGIMLSVYEQSESPANSITAWNISSGEKIYTLDGNDIWLNSTGDSFVLAHNARANEEAAVAGGLTKAVANSTLALYSVIDGELLQEFEPNTQDTLDVTFASDAQHFVSTSIDGVVRVYSVREYAPLQELKSNRPSLTAFLIWEGQAILECTATNQYVLWDVESGNKLSTFRGEHTYLLDANISPKRDRIVSSSGYHAFEVFDIQQLRSRQVFAWKNEQIGGRISRTTEFELSDNEQLAALVLNYTKIYILNLATMQWIAEYETEAGPAPLVAISPDSKHIYYRQNANQLNAGNVETSSSVVVSEFDSAIASFAIDPTGTLVAIVTEEDELIVWNIPQEERTHKVDLHSSARSVTFDPRSPRVLVGCDDGQVWTYHLNNRSVEPFLSGRKSPIWDIAMDPQGKLIGTAALNGTVVLWNAITGALQFSFGIDEFNTTIVEERLRIRFARNGKVFLIQRGELESTMVVDTQDGSALLNLPSESQLELTQDNNMIWRVRQPGIIQRVTVSVSENA